MEAMNKRARSVLPLFMPEHDMASQCRRASVAGVSSAARAAEPRAADDQAGSAAPD